jgi:hypothetical protein
LTDGHLASVWVGSVQALALARSVFPDPPRRSSGAPRKPGQALIGRTPSGDLYLYESDGQGGWLNNGIGIKIGTSWNMFSTFMSPGDWNGDGLVDLIGITPSGVMDLYETDGHGNWLNNGAGRQIGSGWNFKAVF